MRLVTVALRTRWLWLGAAVLVAALGGAATWVANRNYPGMRFIEYRMAQPLDTPTAIAAAPDGTIWFTIDLAAAIGRVHDGRLERLSLASSNVEPIGLGAGPDGSAWYTDNGARAISRITPTGEISSFPLGTPIVRLGRLTVAPQGAVWFAEATGYRMTLLHGSAVRRRGLDGIPGTRS